MTQAMAPDPEPELVDSVDGRPQLLSLWEFFSECFIPLSGLEIPLKGFHREVCDAIQQALLGQLGHEFLVLNIAPRVGKTKICEAAIMWQLGILPDSQFIYTVYSNSMAVESSRYIQGILRSEWYQRLFTGTRLGNLQKAEHFNTTMGGQLFADGTDGSLLGRGAGIKGRPGGGIFIDDASKPSEAQSQVQIETLHRWFEGTIKNRRNSSLYCPIVACQQRMGPDDLSGYILANYPGKTLHLKFPAMVNGASIIPETVSTESLLDTQRVNPFAFASMYMQEPIILGGNMIKPEWFGYCTAEEASQLVFEYRMVTSDTAWKTREANDWSVFQAWGKLGAKIYLLDQVRGKWESPQMIAIAREFWAKHREDKSSWLRKIVVEDHASGTAAIQQLVNEGIPVEPVLRVKDKVTRVEDILPMIATGRVVLPKTAAWLAEFLLEMAAFRKDGNHKHDDQVDPLADACKMMLGQGLTIFDVMRKPGDPAIPAFLRRP